MQYTVGFILLVVLIFHCIDKTYGHGYLADPPARSSAWLMDRDFRACCTYYEHTQMFCGGINHQWSVNGGKCSICGEAYDQKTKLFDKGGEKYLGKIVRTYTQGSVISVTVILTANHLGLFEFRVCSIDDDSSKDATQSCLDLNVLNTTDGLTQYRIPSSLSTVQLQLRLPAQLVCKHCVFQWKYQTGNSWGVSNGRGCLGCGKENEEFYGCSDVAIIGRDESIVSSTTVAIASNFTTARETDTIASTTTTTTTTKDMMTESLNCTSIIKFSRSFDISVVMEKYCETVCANNCSLEKKIGDEKLYNSCAESCNKLCVCQ
ncbi:unnamed protein product [Rotaria socialis]|uniref:Chitin-binding type-4 domain-containing protein n=1 Tax=Rotaria socialis TaxID=392032 RepID=A0A818EYV4_9BILA|nr:unnamed protein product [Rotaria socialis]CAF4277748.1 unnamed protein product [Rotaria socialis]